jgi:DNA-binding PadR family transcriptional regulator
MESSDPVDAWLPLHGSTFYILLSLAQSEGGRGGKHGYAILQDVEALSEGQARLSTGTLYEALGRLLEQGLVERVEEAIAGEEDTPRPGKPRKLYRLSRLGWRVLAAETRRLESMAAAARTRLGDELR